MFWGKRKMELAKLRYFQAVAKLQHVTKAAEELHLTQPALTKAIKGLEEELGVPLFYKQGRGVRLTAQGIFLKEKLDILLPALEELPTLLAEFNNREKRTIRLNMLAASPLSQTPSLPIKKRAKTSSLNLSKTTKKNVATSPSLPIPRNKMLFYKRKRSPNPSFLPFPNTLPTRKKKAFA